MKIEEVEKKLTFYAKRITRGEVTLDIFNNNRYDKYVAIESIKRLCDPSKG